MIQAVKLLTNPYSKPAFEDAFGGTVRYSLRELREHNEKVWKQGYSAALLNAEAICGIEVAENGN